jgi:hypothetical protein
MPISLDDRREKRVLDEFVTIAREYFSLKFPNQDFDAPRWDYRHLFKSSTRKSDRFLYFVRHQPRMTKASVLKAEALPHYFSEIVKSVLLLHCDTMIRVRLTAFRILWESIRARFGKNGDGFRWYLLRERDLRDTEKRMTEIWTNTTVYTNISALVFDLRRLAARNIVVDIDAVPETPCPKYTHRHTLEGNEAALAKLPKGVVLEALADIYAKHATNPPDRLIADALAILAVTGLRLDEVLTLSSDCLIKRTVNNRQYTGLRVSKRKSAHRAEENHILWLTPLQASIVVPAIEEARTMTQTARDRAKELEQNPGRVILPAVKWSDALSSREVARLIGFVDNRVVNRIPREELPRQRVNGRFVFTATNVESYLRFRLKGLWTLKRTDGTHQTLSQSLFVVFKNFFGSAQKGKGSRPILQLLVEPITQQQIRAFLIGIHLKDGTVNQRSAFERFNLRDLQTGEVLKMNAHQCRHWITHNAVRGGMPIRDMARWHGRERLDDVFTYIHMTSTERIEWVRHKLESGELRGPFVEYYFSLADDVKDLFLEGRLAAIHVTHMGLCLHDFTLSPCKFKLACLSGRGCPEYAFDPSDTKQRTNLVQLVGRTKTALTQATAKAKTTDPALAKSWVEDAQSTIANAERVLSSAPAGENLLVRPFVGQLTKFQAIGKA